MPIEASPAPSPARHSSIDLQLCVLRNLPTPILVLSPSRTTVFANRATAKLLGQSDPIQSSSHTLHGRSPSSLGINLLYNRIWDVVLDKLVAAQKQASEDGEVEDTVHELDVVVVNGKLSYEETHFRILASTLTADDGVHCVLSFERATHGEKKFIPGSGKNIHFPDGDAGYSIAPNGNAGRDKSVGGPRDILKIKKAVFDSRNVAGFILSVDEKFYLTNKKTREVLGNIMGGEEGCDGLSLRANLEIWDENFSRRLEPAEFPGMKLVRAKAPFTNYRCGFTHATTGAKIVMSVSGECLYDDDTGEFMGGICWCYDLQEYSDFLSDQMQTRLKSHETICNLMPHLVWNTQPDGMCDWFSQRWYEFTGMTREDSIGVGFQKAVHSDDLPVLLDKWNIHRIVGNECEVEVRYRRHDGVYKWMLARACPLRDESGNILKWYGTNTDIHDLVMARIEAARNKLQMLSVLSHAEVNLFSIDKDRKITMAEGGEENNDNSAINQTIAIKQIRKLGFPVTATWNGREALSYLLSPSASQPRPSIILMDVQMPIMDGYEATRILRMGREYSEEDSDELNLDGVGEKGNVRKKRPLSDIPVIAMTASAIQGDKEKCHDAGWTIIWRNRSRRGD